MIKKLETLFLILFLLLLLAFIDFGLVFFLSVPFRSYGKNYIFDTFTREYLKQLSEIEFQK